MNMDGRMPPTRGHDLKLSVEPEHDGLVGMPPTRGHDLKPFYQYKFSVSKVMPPTRGHDLKLLLVVCRFLVAVDAPHTGARLETQSN